MHSPYNKKYNGDNNKNYVYNTVYPLFPFGFGLNYLSENDIIHKYWKINEIKENCYWVLSINVTNNNKEYDQDEVVQIYYTKWVSKIVRYELTLAGFTKVRVPKCGETVTANIDIYADSLSYYDIDTNEWILEQGEYLLYDGKSAKEFNFYNTIQFNITKSIYSPCKFWEA